MLLWLCFVVGFRPRFHSGYLAPSDVSCLKRQTTLRWPHLIFSLIQWPPGNVQSKFRYPFLLISKRNACALPKKKQRHDSWSFFFLGRSISRREGTATGGAVSAYDHNSLYFIFGQTRDGKFYMYQQKVIPKWVRRMLCHPKLAAQTTETLKVS